jgi:GNAT superfamily N-acetyltransferase
LFVLPEVPGLVTEIGIPGVRGRVTPVSHPIANLVGCADLDETDADATIAVVRERYAAQGLAFGWMTSAAGRPRDLPQRLVAAGMVKADELAGMVLTDLATPVRSNRDIEVRPAGDDDQRLATGMFAEAYGMPLEVARWFVEAMILAAGKIKTSMYHAYVPDRPGPVAVGNLVFVPDSSLVLLGGAATLSEFRGRGIYTTLVAKRLADARAAGAEAAVIQAVRGTSAPVCAKLGFTEVLALELYAWLPPGVDMDLHA